MWARKVGRGANKSIADATHSNLQHLAQFCQKPLQQNDTHLRGKCGLVR